MLTQELIFSEQEITIFNLKRGDTAAFLDADTFHKMSKLVQESRENVITITITIYHIFTYFTWLTRNDRMIVLVDFLSGWFSDRSRQCAGALGTLLWSVSSLHLGEIFCLFSDIAR